MSLRMNPTPLGAIDFDSYSSSSSSSITTSEDVDAGLVHNEATLSDLQPAVNAAAEDDVAVVAEEPQCKITVVESDQPNNPVHAHVQQQQLAELQLQQEQPQDQLPAPISPQPASATDVHFVAGADIQAVAGAGRVPWQRRLQNQVRRLGATGNEPDQAIRRSGSRQIRRPRKFLDCVVPYFCYRKPY